MPVSDSTLDFTTQFDLTSSPKKFVLTDIAGYVAAGSANEDIRGNFKIVDPLANLIHDNYTTFNTSLPDIVGATSFIKNDISIPLVTTTGLQLNGDYVIDYKVRVDDPITVVDVGTKKFTIVGDAAKKALIDLGTQIIVVRSTGNNATYTLVAVVVAGADLEIEVSEAIADATADGSIQFANQEEFTTQETVTLSAVCPTVAITHVVDCNCGTIRSVDATTYGDNATIVTRTHTVSYPAPLGIADVTETSISVDTIDITPIYTKTWTTEIATTVSYTTTNGTILCSITGSRDVVVNCDLSLCQLSCCLLKLDTRYLTSLADNGKHSKATQDIFNTLTRVAGQLIPLWQMARDCSERERAETLLAEIKELAGCGDGCGCDDDTVPVQIVPICGAGSGTIVKVVQGTGITVTTVVSGSTTTYTVAIEDSLNTLINTLAPVNVVSGTGGTAVVKTVVNGVDTYTVSHTGSVGDTVEELGISVEFKFTDAVALTTTVTPTICFEKGDTRFEASGTHTWTIETIGGSADDFAAIKFTDFLTTTTDCFIVQCELVKYSDALPSYVLQVPLEVKVIWIDDDLAYFLFTDNNGNPISLSALAKLLASYNTTTEQYAVTFHVLIKANY